MHEGTPKKNNESEITPQSNPESENLENFQDWFSDLPSDFAENIQKLEKDASDLEKNEQQKIYMEPINWSESTNEAPKASEAREHRETPSERISKAFSELREKREQEKESRLRPKVSLRIDGGAIENHQLDIIDVSDDIENPRSELYFKLTEQFYSELKKRMETEDALKGDVSEDTPKEFLLYTPSGSKREDGFYLADAWKVERGNLQFRISKGEREFDEIRSTLGMVQVEMPPGTTPEEVAEAMESFLGEYSNVQNGLSEPNAEDEEKYKKARIAWWQKKDRNEVREDEVSVLKRKEVFPGYQTMVMEGYHKEFLEKQPYALYHEHMGGLESLPAVMKSGLVSTTERRKRGLFASGLSSAEDIMTGGADSVFTRIVRHDDTGEGSDNILTGNVMYVLRPSLLDRTDMYAYGEDCFGKTTDDQMRQRLTVADMLEPGSGAYVSAYNEQMFRCGVNKEEILALACKDTGWKNWATEYLQAKGIQSLNGESVETLHSYDKQTLLEKCRAASVDELQGQSPEDIADMFNAWTAEQCKKNKIKELGGKTIVELGKMETEERKTFLSEIRANNPAAFNGLTVEKAQVWFDSGDERTAVIGHFRKQGISEVNGKPITEFVRYVSEDRDIIDIATEGMYSNQFLKKDQE